jgi:phage terminase large subunit-like protein
MALSNTAVPRYYGAFRDAVLRGEIPVNREVSMQMNLIDGLIEDPRFYYDDTVMEGWIRFCENELTLTDGGDLKLLDSFKLWAEDIYSWFYFVERSVWVPNAYSSGGHYEIRKIKKRLRNKQYLIVGRGAAKSVYCTCIQADGLILDSDATDQIVTAPTIRQSEETLLPLKIAIARSRGPVLQFMTEGSLQNTTGSKADRVKIASTKKGIENFITNSIIESRPMRIDKLQGARCKYATVDEWLSGDVKEDVVGALEQGASKVDDWLIVATSSEGTVRNGPGDTIKMELMDILKGTYRNPHVSIWWYKLDDISELNNPNMWVKANPNLGATVTYETYQIELERAEKNPSVRNDILAKRFGLPREGYTYFFTYDETKPHRRQYFDGMACSLGADLSQGDDFCAFTFLFPLPGQGFGVKARSYITSYTFNKLPRSLRSKYENFMREGSLIVMESSVLDLGDVYEDLYKFIGDRKYNVQCLGYDPYNAPVFINRWEIDYGPYGIEKVPQGVKTESVPLGEIKIMAERRQLFFDEEIMTFCMGNCVAQEDTNGNRKLLKKRRQEKIDNVAALLDAYIAYKANKDMFE